MTTSLFFIYAPQDGEYLSHIENQLQVLGDNGLITVWHQGKLAAGSNWYAVTETELGKAQIVLLIVSASFLASDSCKDWLKKADALGKQIVPIIASSCLWEYDPILKGKTPLPRKDQDIKATPLNKWTPIADGYNTVVEGIAALVEEYTRPAPIHPTTSRTTDNSNNSNNSSPKNSNNMSTQNLVFENGYALLIGVGKDLPATINDATALYDLLTDPKIAAFPKEQVILLTQEQATRQGILTALQQLADMVKKGKEATDRKTFVVSKPQNTAEKTPTATVIISYAGHGDVNSRDEYYLCSYDYITKVSNQPLWGTEFTDAVNAIPSKKKLVILDCCHAGGVRSETHNSNHTKLIAALEKGGGSAILAACQDNEKAQDLQLLNKGKHGLFTQVLINALKTPTSRQDGYVRFTDIMAYFENNFSNELQLANSSAKQTPIISKLENYNLNEPFIVCSYDIVKARGGIKPPTSEPIPDLNNNTTNITGNGNNANPPKTNENNMQELKKRLRQFQAEQIQLLGNNLDNAAQVLNNIEDSGYSYDDVKLEWYRGQLDVINSGDPKSIELVKQLKNFINALKIK
jgi:hypothetical protein